MSGFVALLNLDGTALDSAIELPWLQSATAALAFRGPDAQNSWHSGSVGLGHTLLRVTFEPAHDAQPCTLDGELWLVADARIDDRAGLIARLCSHGRSVDGAIPDSLLILHAYTLWGEDFLDYLMGDFAFVLWDGRAQRLICARDHAGVVPLFYARQGNCLVISNTLDVVRSFPSLAQGLDEKAVVDFLLTNSYLQNDATIYAAIRRLPPAHKLVAQAGGPLTLTVSRYWQPAQEVEYLRYRQPQEYVEHFLDLFHTAVADRLRTNYAGSALSGGLDSTSIAVMAQRILTERGGEFELRGATVTHERLLADQEGAFAQQVADFAGFRTVRYAAEECFARVPLPAVAHPDPEPWTINSLWAEPTILRETAQFARLYLMGFGGDPLLSWARLPWRQALRLGQWRSPARDLRAGACSWWRARMGRDKQAGAQGIARLQAQASLLAPPLREQADPAAHWAQWQSHLQVDQRRGMFSAPLWETIFRISDPGYGGLPLKVSFPFFDRRLVDYLMRVPPDPWCLNKGLLRQAMRGLLPESVRLRPKTPLGPFAFGLWVAKEGIPSWVEELVAYPALGRYVDQKALGEAIHKWSPPAYGQWQSWLTPLAFAHWLRQHQR